MTTANKLMCHVVAGYPSPDECVDLMVGMQKLGVGIIEVQIPFSDPIADGETIMRANDVALDNGMDIQKSLGLIKQARSKGLKAPVYIMSYLQKLFHYGIAEFCRAAADCGVRGLIVPDLPFESPEYDELRKAAEINSLEIVPVISPGMSEHRLLSVITKTDGLVYLTSMKGTTGKNLSISDDLTQLAKKIKREYPDLTLSIGFGVQNAADVRNILKIADIAVVGSSVIRQIQKAGPEAGLSFIKDLAA